MSSYTRTKSISKSLILLSLLAVVFSGGMFLFQKNMVGADAAKSGAPSCGVPLYKQTDKKWAGNAYGYADTAGTKKAYIKGSGCGPTSAAMILKAYGKKVTPADTASFCLSNGYRSNGQGTTPKCFEGLAKKYSLKLIRVTDRQQIKQLLTEGRPAIVLVGPGSDKKYTSGGHYIVVAGISGTTVSINDPNKNITSDSFTNIYDDYRKDGFWFYYPDIK